MHPTPYSDVNAILVRLLCEVQSILGDRSLGMYLYGSLATGDFDPHSSDINFLVVTTAKLPHEVFRALQTMHALIAAGWGLELKRYYIPKRALRKYDRADATHPRLNRGEGLVLQ